MTMINRTAPDASPTLVDSLTSPRDKHTLRVFDKGRATRHLSDSPPGNIVIWRGLSRLIDIELGATISAQLVGNRKPRFCICRRAQKPGLTAQRLIHGHSLDSVKRNE
jgi:hypothetical protein